MKPLCTMAWKAIKRFWSAAAGLCGILAVVGKPDFIDLSNSSLLACFLFVMFLFGCFFGWSEGRRSNERDALVEHEVEAERERKQAEFESQFLESSIRSDIESMSFDGKVLLACLYQYGQMDFPKGCKTSVEKLLNGSSLFVKVIPISPDKDRLMLSDVGKDEVERNKDLLKEAFEFDPGKYPWNES